MKKILLPLLLILSVASFGQVSVFNGSYTGTGVGVRATAPTITLPNATGLPVSTGISGLGTGVATALAANTNATGGVLTGGSTVSVNVLTVLSDFRPTKTITAAGTTGAQTINKTTGTVNFAAGASTLVVTNSFASTSSVIMVTVYGTDLTAISARVTKAVGSFTITLNAAATAETAVGFMVTN